MLGLLFRRRRDDGDRNYVALLSLKLLLLAFFIMLNALSSYEEEKARAVLESVNNTFQGDASHMERHASFDQALDNIDDKSDLVVEIERLFETTIPAVEREQGSTQNFLRLRLPVRAMFLEDEVDLASGRELLLKRLAQSLQKLDLEERYYEFEFLYGTAARNTDSQAELSDLILKRLEAVANEIVAAGILKNRLVVGLQPNRAGSVFVVIRIYDKAPPNITFSSYREER
ncbi:flagellar motor protein MotB [Kiloniella sp. EL199]|uniref:flagellar motor protein MotB n=1 Tax=Kiloniella sp. EL199 TaxID=2107581 RepID=UPI000EA148DE|nr:flagellar motor protein MotB [Kiloniella sp. EL199]